VTASSPPPSEDAASLRAERDALAEKLRDADDRFRLLYDHSPIPLSVVSVADARYVYVNRAHLEYYGRPAEYYYDTDPYQVWIDVTLPEEFEHERVLFQQVADGALDTYALEKNFRLPDGSTRRGELTLTVSRDAHGRLQQLVGVTRDMGPLRAAELAQRSLQEQLERSQKVEVLGRMAGGVAHDFNNRLLIVLGYAELLKIELSDPRLRSFLDLIIESGERSAELTRQLLAFSRRQVLAPRSLDAGATLERMRRVLESLLSEKIELVFELSAEQRMFCDPGQLEQVILNLVINARDAMPAGGKLTLRTRDVEAGSAELPAALAEKDFVALEVSDSGSGIAHEVLPHIFEPFFTTKPAGAGTGLGLSTVEGIVRQSGGHVGVTTAAGIGTTVSAFLPISEASVKEVVVSPLELDVEARPGRLATILICDDDAAVRKLIGAVLAIGAYRIVLAKDIEQVRSFVASGQKPDLLVTDIVMPGATGPELARELRTKFPELLVLFVSGFADEPSLESIVGEEFLAKPFLPAALLKRVRQMLDARAGSSASGASAG
jgi:PAS domain S-box-containing protein